MFKIRHALAAAAPLLLAGALAAPIASADHTRQHTCEQAGGTFVAASQPGQERCVVTTETSVTAPSGEPTITYSEPRSDGTSPLVVDGPSTPDGEPTTTSEVRNVGDPVSVVTVLPGTPVTTERTEEGTPTSVETPGTQNCERVNNEKGKKSVEKCERTVVTTTTTPTTVVTTVTTPQTERTVTTQPREECFTTTQPTSFVRTTTQGQVRDETVTVPQQTVTTTTTTTFGFTGGGQLRPIGAPVVTQRTDAAEPLVTTTTVPAEPSITMETLAGEPIVTGPDCAPTDPEITTTERELEPLVVETSRPGEPIVTVSTRGTDQTCYNNPSTAEQRRNACV